MPPGIAVFSATFALFLLSCGAAPSTVAPTAPASPVAHPLASASSEPAPDLSPRSRQWRLAGTVHFAHPRATLQQIASLVGPWAALLLGGFQLDADSLVTTAVGAPIASLVDLDQPLDIAIADIDSPQSPNTMAGSVVLSDPVAARETLEKYYRWTPTASGVVRLDPRQDAPDGASPRHCLLMPALASTGGTTRLVCGGKLDDANHLGPYLVRSMTRLTSRDDLRVELFVHEYLSTVPLSWGPLAAQSGSPGCNFGQRGLRRKAVLGDHLQAGG